MGRVARAESAPVGDGTRHKLDRGPPERSPDCEGGHPDRYEKDAEKDLWFKKSGILCIQHFTAERCYNESAKVVSEFLGVLAQHKK